MVYVELNRAPIPHPANVLVFGFFFRITDLNFLYRPSLLNLYLVGHYRYGLYLLLHLSVENKFTVKKIKNRKGDIGTPYN